MWRGDQLPWWWPGLHAGDGVIEAYVYGFIRQDRPRDIHADGHWGSLDTLPPSVGAIGSAAVFRP